MKKISTFFIALTMGCFSMKSFGQISFTDSPGTGCAPLNVTFVNTSTNLPGTVYNWDFGDGSPIISGTFTSTVSHTYYNKGNYSPTLKAYNNLGILVGQYSGSMTNNTFIVVNGLSSYDQLYLYPKEACPNQNISVNAPWGFQTYIFNYGDGTIDTATTNYRNHQYAAIGDYAIKVTILDVCNGNDTTLKDTVSILPTMYFSWGAGAGGASFFYNYPNQVCPGEYMGFSTVYGYARYIWNFGDGKTDTTQSSNINHSYNSIGNYSVSVKIINYCGDDTTIYTNAKVEYSPFQNTTFTINSQFSSEPVACPGESLNFSAPYGYVYYVWDFGDGSPVDSGNTAFKNHSFSAAGNYISKVKIHQACGNDTTLSDTVKIVTYSPYPSWVNIYDFPDPACPFKEINFYGAYGYANYKWSWGDGTPVQNTPDYNKSHTYTSGGVYNVTLTITNKCGNDTAISKGVIIDPNLPFIPGTTMEIDKGSPACPGKVNFSANPGYQYYIWNFGDGDTETSISNIASHSYPALGNYAVSVKIIDHCGKDTTITKPLKIKYEAFDTGLTFYVNDNNSCPGQNINFSAPWGYVSYKWNFGDGTLLTGSNYVNHSYNAVGQYIATVKIKQLCGNDTTLTKIVKVINNQSFPNWVSMSAYPTNACPGENVNFQGPWGFASYIWDFGDGNIDTTSNGFVEHQFSGNGTFSASLKVINYCGLDTTLTSSVTIDNTLGVSGAYLNAWFPNGTSSCPGENVNFNASWGFPSYTWDFGDGTAPLTGSFNFFNHAYPEEGSFVAKVVISNACGNDTTVTQTITIEGNKPIGMLPMIGKSPMTNQCPGVPITFSGPQGYASYVWIFGDGSSPDSTTSNSVSHAYASPGNYTVGLKIINFCGKDTTNSTTITVESSQNPYTTINTYPNPICPNQKVVFSADTNFASYFWDFGDGFNAYGSDNVNHSYASLGSYSASLIVKNFCGISDTFLTTINVDTSTSFPNWMNLWSNSWGVCPGEVTTLNTQPGFSSYLWNFGDGDTMTTTGPTIGHVYELAGSYTASVTINNGCGNSTTLTGNITLNSNASVYPPNIYSALNAYCPGDPVMFLLNDYGNGGGNGGNGGAQNYTYYWDFGDGNADTTYGIGATHSYDSAGAYTTVVTITNLCGNSTSKIVPVNINDNTYPTLNGSVWGTLSKTSIVGCPGDAVVFYFQGTGENLWNFGDGSTGIATEEFINSKGILTTVIKHAFNADGNYSVSLTLTNGCGNSVTDSITIQVISDLLVDGGLILEPPVGTNSYTTCRELNFIAFGGSSYEWNFGDGSTLTTISPTVSHIYATPNNFAVSVIITNECGNSTSFSAAINISESGGPSQDSTFAINASCAGGNDGTATVYVSGGDAPYEYLWDDELGQEGSTATGLMAGTYSVTISDANGCDTKSTVSVGEADEIILSSTSTNTSCGGSSGSVSVSVESGGNFPYTYLWSNGSSSSTNSNISAGAYSVTLTDASGCSATTLDAVSENGGPSLTINSISDVTCYGNNNGSINITAGGTNSPFTYLWSDNSSTDDVSGLSAGNYSVTVTDNSGCSTVKIIEVDEPEELSLAFSSTGTPCGAANGSAVVSVTGGTSPYTYLWDSNAGSKITPTATGLSANAYRVTVTDGAGCTSVGVVTINNTNSPSLSVNKTNISCPGLSNGAIDLTVSKGTTPYTFIWTWSGGSSFVEDQSGLSAGVYTVMVQDASNCWIGTSVTLTAPTFSSTVVVEDATCIGSANGNATVLPTGGASPYTYLWSNTKTSASNTGLVAGTYYVSVTDTNNCTIKDTAIVGQPATMTLAISKTNVSCYGGSNGTATVSVTGGSSPFSYLWSNGNATTSVSLLSAGKIIVTVTDSCGTSKKDSVTITQPTQLLSTVSKTNVSCYGGGNGTATVAASGGTSPYNYSWNNGQTTALASGLFPGVQLVNVFDANSCLASNNITITQPQALSATGNATAVSCYSGNNGTINVSVSGGTSPYNYYWSNGATTEDLTGLIAGNYTCTITDSCNSTAVLAATVNQPGTLVITSSVSDVKCNGATNGSINLSVSSGVSPYSFVWSNGSLTEDISGLGTGTFYVTVTDFCNQSGAHSATVNQPATLSKTISNTNVSCNGMGDGTATVTPSGGISPYTFNWSNGQTTQTAVGLFPGNYSVNVVDANGCLATGLTSIIQPTALSATQSVSYVSCNAGSDGSVNVTVNGGTSPYTFLWSNGSVTEDISGLSAGNYSVSISDSCGAQVILSATITQPGSITISSAIADVKCFGANNGSVNITASGGVTPYSFSWSNGAISEDIANLSPDTYFVTVTDACSQTGNFSSVVNQPLALSAIISKTNVTCNGMGNGTASVSATGGTFPYTYNWNNGLTSSSVVGLFPGNYSVNVVDANACLASGLISITQPSVLNAAYSSLPVSCNGGNDGSVNISVGGGTSPYSFLWSNGDTTEDVTALGAGNYSVTVSDSCNSQVILTANIIQPNSLSVSNVITHVKCNGMSNGSIVLSVTGGVSPYSFLWSDSSISENLLNLMPGLYLVTVTDGCNQEKADSFMVNQPAALNTTVTKTNITCNGLGNGTATVFATGGTPPYIYQWNSGQNSSSLIGLFAGTYSVNVFDFNTCLASNSVMITQPQSLNVNLVNSNTTCGNQDAFASATVSGGSKPYSYQWTGGSTDSTAIGLGTGLVSVNVTDTNGCTASASTTVGTFVPQVEICLVTVDSSNTKNLVVWEKPPVNYIDSFRIYRDIVGTYTYIGSVDYSDLSKFVDFTFGVNPSITSYKYRVTAIDTCGNQSALGGIHKTMHLTSNLGTQGEVNLIWDGYDGFGLANFYYRILRDSTGMGNYQVLDSVSNSNFTYSDWNVPSGNVKYMVEVVHPFGGCLVTLKSAENHNSSRSNRSQAANAAALSGTVTTTDATQGNCDGAAEIIATGGIPPYTYQWDASANNQTTATATGLCEGFYNVTVTDNNGNTFVTYANIGVLNGIKSISNINAALIYPNPNNGLFTLEIISSEEASMDLFNILGEKIISGKRKIKPGKNKIKIDVTGYGAGIYSLRITSEKGIVLRRIVVE